MMKTSCGNPFLLGTKKDTPRGWLDVPNTYSAVHRPEGEVFPRGNIAVYCRIRCRHHLLITTSILYVLFL